MYLFQDLFHLHGHHPPASPNRGRGTRPSVCSRSPRATSLNHQSCTLYRCQRASGPVALNHHQVSLLTCFVLYQYVHFLVHGHFERFVLGVFGLVRGHTSVRLHDKRLGHVAALEVACVAVEFSFRRHDDDAEEESCRLVCRLCTGLILFF